MKPTRRRHISVPLFFWSTLSSDRAPLSLGLYCMFCCVLTIASGSIARAQFYVMQDTVINWTLANNIAVGRDAFGHNASPTLFIVKGGLTGGVRAYNTSTINIAGGQAESVLMNDQSNFVMTSGALVNGLELEDHTTATVSGGDMDSLATRSHATAVLDGGLYLSGISASDDSKLTFRGGDAQVARAWGDATLTIDGGVPSLVIADGSSLVHIHSDVGGEVRAGSTRDASPRVSIHDGNITGDVTARGSSALAVFGGTMQFNLIALDDSAVTLLGGSVAGDLIAKDASSVVINGGTVAGNLIASGGSILNVSGGSIDGPEFPGWYLYDHSFLHVHGFGLGDTLLDPNYNGMFSEYSLFGSLADGTSIDGKLLFVQNGRGANFELLNSSSNVPEPGILALLGGLTVPSLMLLRRRGK